MSSASAPGTIEGWVRRLGDEEFPLFAHTARTIASMSGSDNTPASDLAQVILRDNAMTARLLKMANSVYYNPGGIRISTVSRAIVILGFNTVRNLALSVSLVETMLSGSRHDNALAELVCSFHAAVQAKEVADEMKLVNTEELFIAALLYRIGAVAFWCFPYGKDDALDWQYHNSSSRDEAEVRVLGFTLRDLTVALTRDWQLSTLLATALTAKNNRDRALRDVEYAYRLADAVSKGWDQPETTRLLHNIAQMVDKPVEWVTRLVFQNAQKAAKVMEDFGITQTSRFIPPPPGEAPATPAAAPATDQQLQLQLSILRELTTLLAEKADLNIMLSTVLEGIYRGLKMDHVVLAMADAKLTRLSARFVLGKDRDQWLEKFQVGLAGQENIFTHVMALNEPLWVDKRTRLHLGPLLAGEVQAIVGNNEFCLSPIRLQGQVRGVIYADRSAGFAPLTEQDFLSFRHFCEHANIGFQLLVADSKRQ